MPALAPTPFVDALAKGTQRGGNGSTQVHHLFQDPVMQAPRVSLVESE